MKHFEVSIYAKQHKFTLEREGTCETLMAIMDAAETFDFEIDEDEVTQTITQIDNCELERFVSARFGVCLKDSEEVEGVMLV